MDSRSHYHNKFSNVQALRACKIITFCYVVVAAIRKLALLNLIAQRHKKTKIAKRRTYGSIL